MREDEPLVTVATFDMLHQAEFARELLESEGIRGFVADGEIAGMAWTLAGAVGGIKLQVAKSDFWAAERVLNNRPGKSLDDYGITGLAPDITAHPQVVRDENPKADPEEIELAGDATVDRAMRAAFFGLILFPPLLHLYSLVLLLELLWERGRVSNDKRTKLYGTLIFDLLVIGAAIAFVMMIAIAIGQS